MLTDSKIKRLKPPQNAKKPDKYSDGNGLQLHVFPNGRMTWIYAYRFNGKQKNITLGSYEFLSLAQARIEHLRARQLLVNGIDPSQNKKDAKQADDESTLFKTLAHEWLDNRKSIIKEATYLRDLSVFEKDIFPFLGDTPIEQIKGKDILECAKRIEERGAQEMAKRSIPLVGRVFRFAIRQGIIENDPTPHLHEALKPRKTKNMARLDISEFPAFLHRMDRYHGNLLVKSALQLMTLTFVRTAELRMMEWQEIDLESKLWRIPAEKMKMALPHIVPLSQQALDILEIIRPITGHKQYVFYNYSTAQPLSSNALLCAIRTMGYKGKMTGHGFRGLASTTLHEQGYMHDAIEVQLAHKTGNAVSQAYNHAQHLDYRIKMMQEWSDYIDGLRNNIVPFPKNKRA
ncbi:tyrosine-type recombinase/integrase [Acinetobacter sp. TR11]|uniref:tyrosine-type recombinase/integrase n=1 Tax=Acinetobacter sp. TR11 TaxID=3003393 RepID=UPI0022AC8E02|nr:integrase arm-type DNA-binding domain-containing protein [Acinetobacter sp. TR11]WAU73769.1 tyrosine-type recombinase/integrase [Acinetobacter sp. TR11]